MSKLNSGNLMIYLDHAATTPVAPEVLEGMLPFLSTEYGNPSSIYAAGRRIRQAVDEARDQVATVLKCDYSEICFTSGGTEANNLAIVGAALAAPKSRNKVVVSAIEHHAVLHAAHWLIPFGYEVLVAPVCSDGLVDLEFLELNIDDRTALVSVMHANNEIGTIQDIAKIAQMAHDSGALFHTDAVQTLGKLQLNVRGIACDLLSVSGHKVYGPKGIGALYVKTGTLLTPIAVGGAQERERRAGTENVAGIVGFGIAATRVEASREAESKRLQDLRDWFIPEALDRIPGLTLNGHPTKRLCNNVSFS
ncbi:MAG: cysteine desulfurase family protein, partial [Chthonomonadales bacterium]